MALLLVTGAALLVARVLWPPRLLFVAGTAFVLTFLYHLIVLALRAFTDGVGFVGLALPELVIVGFLNALIAGAAVPVLRALDLRFGEQERLAW